MFTISQIEGRPLKRVLECVWSLSDAKLTCVWVKPSSQAAAGDCAREEDRDLSQRVAGILQHSLRAIRNREELQLDVDV